MINEIEYYFEDIEYCEMIGEFEDEYVYDIEVDDDTHTFIGNNILVHNSLYISFTPVIESCGFKGDELDFILHLDRVIIKKADNINYIKTQLLTNISDVVNNLLKLQKIDHTISTDGSYKLLINRFGYYLELIDFSDSYKFVENYIRPVLNKYFDQLMWRTL